MNNSDKNGAMKLAIAFVGLAAIAACSTGPETTSSWRGAQLHFNTMDTNDDERLERDEINPDLRLHREFDRYDADATGLIELDEFYDYIQDSKE